MSDTREESQRVSALPASTGPLGVVVVHNRPVDHSVSTERAQITSPPDFGGNEIYGRLLLS
jgi:hypothetical protein